MNKKFTSTVAGASILLTTVGLISRGLGLVREMVFAGSFGLSKAYDLFLVGTVLPLTLNTIIIYIAQNYFIPVYNRLKTDSPNLAKSFIIKSFTMFIAGGCIIMGFLFFFSQTIISLYVNNSTIVEIDVAVKVLQIYSFTIPFNAAFSILAAYLYSEFDFKLPTFAQLFVNIAMIISVIVLADTNGVISIAYGYFIGIILQLIFIFLYILKLKPDFLTLKGGRTKLLYWDSGLILIILIEALSQVYLISDRYFLSQVDKGGIAALNYSMNIFLLPISIISIALSTALFPSFSKSFVENNVIEINKKLDKFFAVNLYFFVPLTFILFFFGDVIIKILFQRGAFSSNDSIMTFETLKFFSLSLIFYSGYTILNKLMYSMELIKELLFITVLGCTAKVVFNYILVLYLKQDGLALSSSLSYIFFFAATLFLLSRRLNVLMNKIFLNRFIFVLINTSLAFLISTVVLTCLRHLYFNNFYMKLLQLTIFIVVYIVNLMLIDYEKIKSLTKNFQFNEEYRTNSPNVL